jgi:hypothetical protein
MIEQAECAFEPTQDAERAAALVQRLREQMRNDLAVGSVWKMDP